MARMKKDLLEGKMHKKMGKLTNVEKNNKKGGIKVLFVIGCK